MTEPDYGQAFAKRHPVPESESMGHSLKRMWVVPGSDRIAMECSCGRKVWAPADEVYPDIKKAQEERK